MLKRFVFLHLPGLSTTDKELVELIHVPFQDTDVLPFINKAKCRNSQSTKKHIMLKKSLLCIYLHLRRPSFFWLFQLKLLLHQQRRPLKTGAVLICLGILMFFQDYQRLFPRLPHPRPLFFCSLQIDFVINGQFMLTLTDVA